MLWIAGITIFRDSNPAVYVSWFVCFFAPATLHLDNLTRDNLSSTQPCGAGTA